MCGTPHIAHVNIPYAVLKLTDFPEVDRFPVVATLNLAVWSHLDRFVSHRQESSLSRAENPVFSG